MIRTKTKESDGLEVDLHQLLSALWSKKLMISVVSVLCAVVAFLGSHFFIAPRYEASTMFYVNNSSVSVGDTGIKLNSSDLNAAKSLVDSYIVILKTRQTLNWVISYTGSERTYLELRDMISAKAVDSTEFFQVVVTSTDPQEAKKLADAIAEILPIRINRIIKGSSAEVVDLAVVATSPSFPIPSLNAVIGFLIGLLISIASVIARELLDVTVREESDIACLCDHPILAAVPDMRTATKGGYYGYGKSPARLLSGTQGQPQPLVGGAVSFAAAEAYKLLRTKLQFSFADDGRCHIIGVTSALAGEGKSLSTVNLAYSLSQLDKRVLLIDCDMRRPTVSVKLKLRKAPGLSNYLTGQSDLADLYQPCGLAKEEDAFTVIAAGRNPPNPVELLSSPRMHALLNELRQDYDYILLDLPPVGEVSDALAVAPALDGILLVVRQNYCHRDAFTHTVQQFAFINKRVLGVVYNCATESGSVYAKKYYKRYHKSYKGSYAAKNSGKS